jgi:hypothetical protein
MKIVGCDLHTRYQQIAMAGGPHLPGRHRTGGPDLLGNSVIAFDADIN